MEEGSKSAFGMIGLGTMGANLLLNIVDHGYTCSGYDISADKVVALNELNPDAIQGFTDLKAFADSLSSPRIVMLLVPAGPIVDSVIEELLTVMEAGDIIIDGGNSHFLDTDRRYKYLEEKNFHFIGMGVSGGEDGARTGPSMMPGGDQKAYEIVKPILTQIAAQVNGEPTVAYMGESSAGHFVKMVHNGIEYALMQLISETYEVLRKGLKLNDSEIYEVYKNWNEGRLKSYLLEITRDIFNFKEKGADYLLLNDIKDEAKSKGTGKWTSQAAMDLNLPVPIIDIAVSMRDLSKYKLLRTEAAMLFPNAKAEPYSDDKQKYIARMEEAFYFATVSAYAQGIHLLYRANIDFKYNLNLGEIAKIWRGGCIIRSAFLEDIFGAFQKNPELEHIFLDEKIHESVLKSIPGIRIFVSDVARHGIAAPAFTVSLGYFDNFRSEQMPANLIQAQRDYFGSHTYERKGKTGVFHTEWEGEAEVN